MRNKTKGFGEKMIYNLKGNINKNQAWYCKVCRRPKEVPFCSYHGFEMVVKK